MYGSKWVYSGNNTGVTLLLECKSEDYSTDKSGSTLMGSFILTLLCCCCIRTVGRQHYEHWIQRMQSYGAQRQKTKKENTDRKRCHYNSPARLHDFSSGKNPSHDKHSQQTLSSRTAFDSCSSGMGC